MSRGLGRVQRELIEQLQSMNPGAGILPGDNGGNTRRAALRLAKRGLVKVEYRRLFGHRRLVIRLSRRRPDDLCV